MSYNFLMIETAPAKEISVAEAIDRLVGVDSSYCPTELRLFTISRQASLKRAVAVPILPRTIFCTASFPDLDAILEVRGVESIIRNVWGQPEIIPGWQMQAFMAEVEIYRLRAIHQQMKASEKPAKPERFKSLTEAAQYLKRRAGERVEEAA